MAPGRSAELFKFLLTETLKHQSQPYEEIKTGYLIPIYLDELTVNTTLVGSAADAWVVGLVFFYVNGDSIMADTVNWISAIFTGTTALDLAGSVEQPKRCWEQLEAWFALPIAERNPNNIEGFLEYPRLVKWFKEALPRTCQKANRQDTKLRINLMEEEVEEGLNMNEITLIRFIDDMVTLMHMGL
ncbi:hypothetical protein SPFM12_00095 [Salmonella phage SPFM12]|nr:hypothetical protein SPFM12_00095 [Salmonella phage SPFM12]